MTIGIEKQIAAKETKRVILWTNLLNESLFTLYGLLAFILRKDLGATAFEIALLTMLKPLVSLFSFYWSAGSTHSAQQLKNNVFFCGILSRAPFLLFPWVQDIWFFIFAAALHMLFSRAGTPAWMEILKLNLPKKEREKHFSLGSALGYAEGVLIAIGFGFLLDHYPSCWKVLFFLSACVGIVGVVLQKRLLIATPKPFSSAEVKTENPLILPWKETWCLMKERKDFARFQWGFMACGFGLMLIQPALPIFFVDVLHVSYTDLAIALSICKGLGFVFSSSVWARSMSRIDVAKLSSLVFIGVGLFPIFLLCTPFSLAWLYVAYFVYGIAQAGSHLIWNLSGPLFSKEESSSLYTNVNIVLVGVRGMIAPPLGGFLCALAGPFSVFALGIFLCFYGGKVMLTKRAAPSFSSSK